MNNDDKYTIETYEYGTLNYEYSYRDKVSDCRGQVNSLRCTFPAENGEKLVFTYSREQLEEIAAGIVSGAELNPYDAAVGAAITAKGKWKQFHIESPTIALNKKAIEATIAHVIQMGEWDGTQPKIAFTPAEKQCASLSPDYNEVTFKEYKIQANAEFNLRAIKYTFSLENGDVDIEYTRERLQNIVNDVVNGKKLGAFDAVVFDSINEDNEWRYIGIQSPAEILAKREAKVVDVKINGKDTVGVANLKSLKQAADEVKKATNTTTGTTGTAVPDEEQSQGSSLH
jgi:hypothetical protein